MKKISFRRVLQAIHHYLIFFLVVAFLVTCCTILFVTTLASTMGLDLTGENVGAAAKITFANVLLLTLLYTAIDALRRKLTVDLPVKRITQAAEQVMQGDFTVQIPQKSGDAQQFYTIINCFNKMTAELSSVETLRTDFIANVSHELKTPLAVIQNYGALLQQPDLDEETRMEYGRAVSHSARRLAAMMTNILKLNRLENQQIYPQSAPYDLSQQLCESLLQFEDLWEKNDIEIETQIQDGVTVKADGELLHLVWSNLLSNAFKFTAPGGTVSVSLTADDRFATVTVTDTGCGMTPEVGAHIFEKFYQGDTSHATRGNGLGLALVKRVIDILRGEIRVESALGKGSTFTVRIRRE